MWQDVAPAPTQPAGFWVRGGAQLIDVVVTAVLNIALMVGLGLAGLPAIFGGLLTIIVPVAYFTAMVGSRGQTIGKMAAGAFIVMMDGGSVGYGRAFLRYIGYWVSGLPLGLGYLIAAFTPGKRALHDYIAGTRVIYMPDTGSGRKAAVASLGVLMLLSPLLIAALAITNPRFSRLMRRSGESRSAFDKFQELGLKSREGATKGNLGSLRAAASIHYGDFEGRYPATLEALVPKYLPQVPSVKIGDHPETAAWTAYGAEVCSGGGQSGIGLDASKLKDTGTWGYAADEKSRCWGTVFVDCTHSDTRGTAWHTY